MKYFAGTDIGNIREKNEDSFYCDEKLFIVADGMGGHKAGEIASSKSIDVFKDLFLSSISSNKNKNIKKMLLNSLKEANKTVYGLSINNNELYGMGTTFTACHIRDNTAYIVHLGDSRFYHYSKEGMELSTKDHTVVWELYENGIIAFEEMFDHPQRNLLTKVLGTSSSIEPDVLKIGLDKNDLCLMCTDGLNSMLTDKEIEKILKDNIALEKKVHELIGQAKEKGGLDNITTILIEI